jgi:hypothetical protein
MARTKYDGIVQAVHYGEDGQVLWVRAFLRRGPTWSDHVLVDRQTLVERLKAGKQFVVGKRVERMAGTFETSTLVQLRMQNGDEILIAGNSSAENDCLEGVPLL